MSETSILHKGFFSVLIIMHQKQVYAMEYTEISIMEQYKQYDNYENSAKM